jgi:hypothetical protein
MDVHANAAIMRVGRRPAESIAAPIEVVPHVEEIPNVTWPAVAAHDDLKVPLPEIAAVVVYLITRGERFLRHGHVLCGVVSFSLARR